MFDVGCNERKDERNDIVVSRFHKILASGFGVLLLEVEDTTSLRFAWSQSRSKSEIRQRKLQHLYTDMLFLLRKDISMTSFYLTRISIRLSTKVTMNGAVMNADTTITIWYGVCKALSQL